MSDGCYNATPASLDPSHNEPRCSEPGTAGNTAVVVDRIDVVVAVVADDLACIADRHSQHSNWGTAYTSAVPAAMTRKGGHLCQDLEPEPMPAAHAD